MRAPKISIDELVDHRSNGLNLVRLVLASSVIFWHAFPLTGRAFPFSHGAQIAGDVAVDGFFVISGYLLTGSWLHKPRLLPYIRNRVLRIVPAFWVCLVVVGFVVAPLTSALRGSSPASLFTGEHSAFRYVTDNSLLVIKFYDVAGTPTGVPYPAAWNGSLWTLRWEGMAYIGLALLGLLSLLRRPMAVLTIFVVAWSAVVLLALGIAPRNFYLAYGSRLGFMFLCGTVLALFGRHIPANRWFAGTSVLLIGISAFLPDYRMLAGPSLAYLVIFAGGMIRRPSWQLKDRDISYGMYIYGFPVQQTLVIGGLGHLTPVLFGLVGFLCTVPVALASWVLVERPMLRLKRSRRARHAETPA